MTKAIDQEVFDAAFLVLRAAFPGLYVAVIVADDEDGSLLTNMRDSRLEAVIGGVMENRVAVTTKEG